MRQQARRAPPREQKRQRSRTDRQRGVGLQRGGQSGKHAFCGHNGRGKIKDRVAACQFLSAQTGTEDAVVIVAQHPKAVAEPFLAAAPADLGRGIKKQRSNKDDLAPSDHVFTDAPQQCFYLLPRVKSVNNA